MTKKYVVSLDLELQLARWSHRHGFNFKDMGVLVGVRNELYAELSRIFGSENVQFLDGKFIENELPAKLCHFRGPVVTLDRVYIQHGHYLGMTRAVDIYNNDVAEKLVNRSDSQIISHQYDILATRVQGEVTLVDDVIFTGGFISETLIPELKRRGIIVANVVAGVGIGEGVTKISQHVNAVSTVHHFDDVIDEVCERDFFPGIDLCGRTILTPGNFGAPYILPFGIVSGWASIPKEECVRFSKVCLQLAAEIYASIGKQSRRPVLYRDIDRKFIYPVRDDEKMVDILGRIKASL